MSDKKKEARKAEYERYVRIGTQLGFTSVRAFTKSFGGTLSYPSQVALGIYEFNPGFLKKLTGAYPTVNVEFLKTGKGPMFTDGKTPEPVTQPVRPEKSAGEFMVLQIKATVPRTGDVKLITIQGMVEGL